MLDVYLQLSTLLCFVACMTGRTKLTPTDNLIGSLILSVALGWVVWPFAVIYAFKSRKALP